MSKFAFQSVSTCQCFSLVCFVSSKTSITAQAPALGSSHKMQCDNVVLLFSLAENNGKNLKVPKATVYFTVCSATQFRPLYSLQEAKASARPQKRRIPKWQSYTRRFVLLQVASVVILIKLKIQNELITMKETTK